MSLATIAQKSQMHLRFFGITKDRKLYAEIQFEVAQSCKGSTVLKCVGLPAFRSVSESSCASAVFFDSPDVANSLCDFGFQKGGLFQGTVDLNEGHLLVSGTEADLTWTLKCSSDAPKQIAGGQFCIIKYPCDCTISTSKFIIGSRLSNCHHFSSVLKLYPVNLPALYVFHENNQKHLAASVFKSPPSIPVPELSFSKRRWSSVIANEHTFDSDFKKLARNVRKNSR